MPEKCKYKQVYYDITSDEPKFYECEEDAVKDGYCVFHHPEYWKEHKEEVRKKFMEKVEDAINNKKPLICIGYNLPEVYLFRKTFEAPVYFTKTIFYEEARFGNAKFSGAIFSGATFSSSADFIEATFSSWANFGKTKFSSIANFSEATFSSWADFIEAKFFGAIFSGAKFSSYVNFKNADFEGVTTFEDLKTTNDSFIVFESCKFKEPRLVSFRGTEIMRFLFLSTGIERVSLRNAKFDEKILKVHELLKDPKSRIEYTFDDVIETYGRLRGNLERNHRFSEAGKFFIGEMEARRTRKYYEFLREHEKSKKEGFRERLSFNLKKLYLKVYTDLISPFALYKAFSEYGESIARPIAWSLLTILATPILSMFLEGQTSFQSFINSYSSYLVKSIGLFAQILPVDYPPPSLITVIEVLERLLAILFVGLELMALKRRLERHR
ncbi:MAG: pentapeptide repeat-containing protein [Thermofilum sp.]|nr:pentapeptide repeat-containing protein [Thermofilum sp.]